MNKIAIVVFRIVMGCLIGFELLNGFGVLHFSLVYTRQGLIIIAAFARLAVELIVAHKRDINVPILVMLITIALLLDACGDMFHLYATVHNYDKILHFFTSGVIAYLIYIGLKDILKTAHLSRFLSASIVIALGSLFGALYEIEEFLEDVLINHRQIRLGDGYDTAGDLLCDIVGCVVMALILFYIIQKRKTRKKSS